MEIRVSPQPINRLEADVISIETSRSHGELLSSFNDTAYDKGVGLGVYDIHSPRVPTREQIVHVIESGLKTRGGGETIQSLQNMVAATRVYNS